MLTRRKDAVEARIRSALGSSAQIVKLARSQEFSENAGVLEQLIQVRYAATKRSIRILVDMTCLPKAYLLYLLGCGFQREYVASIDFIYCQGKYSIPEQASGRSLVSRIGLVSEGEWSTLQIPYFEARDFAAGQKDLIVSVGAEIAAALPVIERFEPRRLKLLKIAEAIPVISDGKLSHEQRALQVLSAKANASSQSFELEDVISLSKAILEGREGSTTCLAIGSKPHALACGLASLASNSIDVVCRIPAAYSANEVASSGRFFRFRVEDRFEPRAYL